eukprot:3617138-Rhodomonas_salina.2
MFSSSSGFGSLPASNIGYVSTGNRIANAWATGKRTLWDKAFPEDSPGCTATFAMRTGIPGAVAQAALTSLSFARLLACGPRPWSFA